MGCQKEYKQGRSFRCEGVYMNEQFLIDLRELIDISIARSNGLHDEKGVALELQWRLAILASDLDANHTYHVNDEGLCYKD